MMGLSLEIRNPLECFYRYTFVLLLVLLSPPLSFLTYAQEPAEVQKPLADARATRKLISDAERALRRGNVEEGERLLKLAIETAGEDPFPRLRLAQLYVKGRNLTDAYDIAFPIAKQDPKNAYAFAVVGATMLGVGRFQDARALFFNALTLDRKLAYAWHGFGMLEFYENRVDQSLNNLREAVFLAPNEPDYVFSLAQVSARSERYKAAAEAYHRFLDLSRDTDDERRARIKGLINFLNFLGDRQSLYDIAGSDKTTVQIRVSGNRPLISLRINNRPDPLSFVLDTGSGISVISEQTAKRLKITPITRGGFAKGIGGNGRFEIVYGFLREVKIGDVIIRNVPVYIRQFHSEGQTVDGYIGLSLISKFITTLDYGAETFSLSRSPMAATEFDESIALPLRLTSSGFLSGEVQLAGVDAPLNFIVDTGASVSVISDEVASLDAVSPHATEQRMRVIGSAGVTEGVKSFQLPSLSFGAHKQKDITAIALDLNIINEASGFQQAGILGGNFLKNFRMTFDFRNSRVTFFPNNVDQ